MRRGSTSGPPVRSDVGRRAPIATGHLYTAFGFTDVFLTNLLDGVCA
ncbi:hypothetical protein ABS735_29545 [Streptomyces sp. MMCC 100]